MSFGQRLQIARKKQGYSLRKFAEYIEVSHTAISKYEKNKSLPSSKIMLKIVACLDVTLDYLFSPVEFELKEVEFRKKSNIKSADKNKAEAEILDSIGKYLHIESILGVDFSDSSYLKPTDISSYNDVETLVLNIKNKWDIGSDVVHSVVDLLEENGIKVMFLDFPKNMDGMTCYAKTKDDKKIPIVLVSKNISLERQRFTLLHELGHMLINIKENSDINLEIACHKFAGTFLVPKNKLFEITGEYKRNFSATEIIELKRHFVISATALMARLLDCGLIGSEQRKRMYIAFANKWRKTEPKPVTRKETPKRFRMLVLSGLSQEFITLSKASELLGETFEEMVEG